MSAVAPGPPVTSTLDWRPARLLKHLATVGVLALAAAVVTIRVEPVLVATPCLAAVAVTTRRRRPDEVGVTVQLDEDRCFEGERVEVRVTVRSEVPLGAVDLDLDLPGVLGVEDGRRQVAHSRGEHTATWTLRPRRWGRWTIGPVVVRVRSAGGAWTSTARGEGGELAVYPPPRAARDLVVPQRLLHRIGTHAARRPGAGIEFAGIRDYVPGDAVRRVNWAVSSRRRELLVNEYAAELAADVVVLVDTTADVGPYGASSLDQAVRTAAGIAQAYLGAGDRVGVVGFGGVTRWLAPDVGARQYYRLVDTLLASRLDESYVDPTIARLPHPALPPGALVFALSPLLDARVLAALGDLRQRGHPVVAVDVLTREPRSGADVTDELALRVWRLDRGVVEHGLREMGVVVIDGTADGSVPLERVRLEPVLAGAR